jgi:hypothetical protein
MKVAIPFFHLTIQIVDKLMCTGYVFGISQLGYSTGNKLLFHLWVEKLLHLLYFTNLPLSKHPV